jgi:glycosyltransferase involved in cell wall biosynthesis
VKQDSKVSIIIPAYNEEGIIEEVIKKVKQIPNVAEIIIVDDGSTDNTAKIASSLGVKLLRHPYNKGNGAAIKTGLRAATGDIVLFMDADGQHRPEDIENLLEKTDQYDLVVGSRTSSSESSLLRRLGNGIFNKLASYLAGMKIPDLTSGFRAAKRNCMLEFIHLLPNGFSYPTTTTLAFMKAGYNVAFVPTKALKRVGQSKIRLFRDGMKFFVIILKIITLFHPLKIFLPLSLLFFLVGGGYAVYTVITKMDITDPSVLLLSMSVIIFLVGLVSEQIAALRLERRK